jgi:hypothetical protein
VCACKDALVEKRNETKSSGTIFHQSIPSVYWLHIDNE